MSAQRWLLVALLAIGIAWAVRPLLPGQGPENWFPQADKLHHVWFFALLWLLGARAGLGPRRALGLLLLGYGVGMEAAQSLTATRSASAVDVLADTAGIALGWMLGARSGRQPQEHRG